MADGPEADVDEPPSIQFPPLITVTDLPGATAAGNLCVRVCVNKCPENNAEPPLPFSAGVDAAVTGCGGGRIAEVLI